MLPPPFRVIQGYETRTECEKSRGETRLAKGYDRLLCLPDTVQPLCSPGGGKMLLVLAPLVHRGLHIHESGLEIRDRKK